MSRYDTVFLDRDGTINVKAAEGEYIKSVRELQLLPGVAEAIAKLNMAGIRVIVVTNQRGIASGVMTSRDLQEIHQSLGEELAESGARLDAIYACPHDNKACDCRKPRAGLFVQAASDFPDIDFSRSVMVGDSETDAQAAQNLGITAIRLFWEDSSAPTCADKSSPGLSPAVDWILRV